MIPTSSGIPGRLLSSGVSTLQGTSVSVASPFSARYAVARASTEARKLSLVGPRLEPPDAPTSGVGDGSAANDASVVLLAQVRGVRILLTGDIEPPGQLALRRTLPDLHVDVLKVPHHGSRHQDLDFLIGLRARLALVSVGADNDYGHPDPGLVAALTATGAVVRRTDLDGDLLVLRTDDGIAVRGRG